MVRVKSVPPFQSALRENGDSRHKHDDTITFLPQSDSNIIRYDVAGVMVSAVTMAQTTSFIEDWAEDSVGRFVCVRDVASLMAIEENKQIRELHDDAALVLPDGMPLVWVGKVRRLPVERVCGPDLFGEMMRLGPVNGLKHFFYGGKEGVAEILAARFRGSFPGVQIVGVESPPFGEMSEAERQNALERIRSSGADVVWVGMSSPKQDEWMWTNFRSLPQTLIGVGAAFDFHSGAVTRAPRWMQKSGLEWSHRLASEPRRLWRRYLITAPRFLLKIARKNKYSRGYS